MSEAATRAAHFVAAHRSEAEDLADRLVELIDEPDDFVVTLRTGLASLSDPDYTALVRRASPDVPPDLAIRGPLVRALQGPLRVALREGSSASALWLALRLATAGERQVRLFALPCLERSLPDDPERSWQLMRQLGRGAADWVEVDALAGVWATGVLAEPFRWAELEQLVYSERAMERRLVAATLATIPHRVTARRRPELRTTGGNRALDMLRMLDGDAHPMVQKALAWAVREWTPIDPEGVASLLREETAIAVEREDGHRAWVVRDALSAQPVDLAATLRSRLAGLRRDRHAPATSIAAGQMTAFASLVAEADRAVGQQGERYTRSRA